jgi:hypothetical protein
VISEGRVLRLATPDLMRHTVEISVADGRAGLMAGPARQPG